MIHESDYFSEQSMYGGETEFPPACTLGAPGPVETVVHRGDQQMAALHQRLCPLFLLGLDWILSLPWGSRGVPRLTGFEWDLV